MNLYGALLHTRQSCKTELLQQFFRGSRLLIQKTQEMMSWAFPQDFFFQSYYICKFLSTGKFLAGSLLIPWEAGSDIFGSFPQNQEATLVYTTSLLLRNSWARTRHLVALPFHPCSLVAAWNAGGHAECPCVGPSWAASGLSHVTCFRQWNVSHHDASRGLKVLGSWGLTSWNACSSHAPKKLRLDNGVLKGHVEGQSGEWEASCTFHPNKAPH